MLNVLQLATAHVAIVRRCCGLVDLVVILDLPLDFLNLEYWVVLKLANWGCALRCPLDLKSALVCHMDGDSSLAKLLHSGIV